MIRAATIALLSMAAAPTTAQVQDPVAMTTDPADRAVMAEAAAAVGARQPDLARLDAVLAKLPRPTPLRGMVQAVRAVALLDKQRPGEAVRAVEEAMRLLPDHPVAMLAGAYVLTFSGAPQRAADLWLQVTRSAPQYALRFDEYVLDALVGRLRDVGDRDRADRVQASLAEIGFAGALAPERSAAASATLRAHLAAGERAEAEAAVPGIGDPGQMATLLVDRRYEALWPRIEQWGGPGLEDQSRRYLDELRREWSGSRGFDTGANYARRLAGARAYQAVVALFLPMFNEPTLSAQAKGVEFLTPIVARSLASLGREDEGKRLLRRVQALLADEKSARVLNLDANLMLLDAAEQRWGEVLPQADAFLAKATALGPDVNRSAILTVRAVRACALQGLGRRGEADAELATLLLAQSVQPGAAWQVLACRGDEEGARELLLTRLADEATRDWALGVVQPDLPNSDRPQDRAEHAFSEKLRRDPKVLAAVAKVGRVLPRPVGGMLPPGFDPFASQPSAARRPGSV